MRTLLKWLAGILLFTLVAAAGVFWVSRTQGMTADREAAIEMMSRPEELPGRNAFATLWLLGFDVPDDQVEAVATEDVARAKAWPLPHEEGFAPFASVAVGRFDEVPGSKREGLALCTTREIGCLQKVRRDPRHHERELASMAVLLRQMDELSDAGHYRNEFPMRGDMLAPARLAGAVTAPMTSQALAFVQGDVARALAGTCRSVSMWRRLVPDSDSLLMSMVAIGGVDAHSRLFAEMLAELPDRAPIPAECDAAFAPPDLRESSMCSAMKGEFAYSRTMLRDPERFGGDGAVPWYSRGLFDVDATEGRIAENFSIACDDRGQQAIVADRPLRVPQRAGFELECIANLAGCLLTSISGAGYGDYLQRAQDHGARLKLMSTLLWLHRNAGDRRPLKTRLSARPSGTRSPVRGFEVVDGGRALQVAMYDDSRGDTWQVPLPRSVVDR